VQTLGAEKKKLRKLTLAMENAENRIDIEQDINKKAQNKIHDLTRNIDNLNADLKSKNDEVNNLLVSKRKLDEILNIEQNKQLHYTSLESMVLTGISLVFIPFIFKDKL
jgi:small-conductance mechanosensitive channel